MQYMSMDVGLQFYKVQRYYGIPTFPIYILYFSSHVHSTFSIGDEFEFWPQAIYTSQTQFTFPEILVPQLFLPLQDRALKYWPTVHSLYSKVTTDCLQVAHIMHGKC